MWKRQHGYFCVQHVSKWTLLSLPLNLVSVPAVHAAHFVPTHLIKWSKALWTKCYLLENTFWIAFLVHWSALHAQYQSEKLFISYTNVLWCPQDNKNTSKAVEEKKVVENIKADIQSHWGSHIYVCMCAYIWVFLLLHVSVKRWADEVPVKPAYQTYVNKLATLSSLNFV